MRQSPWMLATALCLVAAWSRGRLQAQGDKGTFADPNHATFTEMPNRGIAGGGSSATLYVIQTPAQLKRTRSSSRDGMLNFRQGEMRDDPTLVITRGRG